MVAAFVFVVSLAGAISATLRTSPIYDKAADLKRQLPLMFTESGSLFILTGRPTFWVRQEQLADTSIAERVEALHEEFVRTHAMTAQIVILSEQKAQQRPAVLPWSPIDPNVARVTSDKESIETVWKILVRASGNAEQDSMAYAYAVDADGMFVQKLQLTSTLSKFRLTSRALLQRNASR